MKEIIVGRKYVALVDDENYQRILDFGPWYRDVNGYATTRKKVGGRKRTLFMHHLVLPPKQGFIIDHKDRERLHNYSSNLRHVTHPQNHYNQTAYSNNTSGYKGVFYRRTTGRWMAQIRHLGRSIYLGVFDDKIAAAKRYDEEARKIAGEIALTNFP